jgi:glycosyltransferase involved in cell wall biosynthesis
MKVLLVISDLGYGSAGKQLTLLATGLPRNGVEVCVAVLGCDGPYGDILRRAGVPVEVFGWTRLVDARPALKLRKLVQDFQPDVVHGWSQTALRVVNWIGGKARKLVSHPLPPKALAGKINHLDHWLINRVDGVMAGHANEIEGLRHLGLAAAKIWAIPPGLETEARPECDRAALCRSLQIPEGARCLTCIGPLEPYKGFREAIWSLDILKYVYNDLHLIIVGAGPDRRRLMEFARALETTGQVHFVGVQAEVWDWLKLAEVVWVPSLTESGVNVALEAGAAARPVVASRLPGLMDVVTNNETGYVVDAGDKVALARQTRLLLDDGERRRQFGEAGRQRAIGQFAQAEMVRRHTRCYEGLPPEPLR